MSDMKVSLERTAPFNSPMCITKVSEGQLIGPRTLNYTLSGTPPYRIHARYVTAQALKLTNSVNLLGKDAMCYAFPMNITGSSFIWTPQLEDPSQDRMAPRAEGNASNLIVRLSSGTSLIWIATEIPEDGNPSAVSNGYISENITVMNEAMTNDYLRAKNGALSSLGPKSLSLQGIFVVALLVAGLVTL